jgi:hypothetical protein
VFVDFHQASLASHPLQTFRFFFSSFSLFETTGIIRPAAGSAFSPIMPSFRLFLLVVTLLVAVAFAAPAPARKRNIQKRSFKVPRQLNTAHPTGPNGMAAMRKVFRKYKFEVRESFMASSDGFISDKKQKQNATKPAGATAGKNQTGSVIAAPEQNAALFLSPVDIGGQTFNLDFDSGSSDL